MSLRLEMLQVARQTRSLLGESADLVESFVKGRLHPNGGFQDRAGNADLYYTVFGIECLHALKSPLPIERLGPYLESFGYGEGLDFVHRCCLARCWAAIEEPELPAADQQRMLAAIESYRSADQGYHPMPGNKTGTAYAAFLAYGAYADFGRQPPNALELGQSLKWLEAEEGAWANERGVAAGATNATAAAVTLLRNLSLPISSTVGDWLLKRFHEQGGFVASPASPLPDLLSTATTLHALSGLEVSFEAYKEPCLDFIDTLWTNEGGFYGHWADDALDCEYTFYGLLAIGHLAL